MTWLRSTVKGTPPLGEVHANCVGCLRRFVSGEALVYRFVPPWGKRAFAHPSCAASLDGVR